MLTIKRALWGVLAGASVLWLVSDPSVLDRDTFFAVRGAAVQYSGFIAICCMSVAMILALRPRWPERWFGGLDKMYRLHKWLGIAGLIFAVVHWLWAQGPKWAIGMGLLERPQRAPRVPPDTVIEQTLSSLRGTAEGLGEWAFYAAAALIILALIKLFPYRQVFKLHRLLAAAYLVLAFHAVVLVSFPYWTTPTGLILAPLLAGGVWAALVVLFGRVAASRKVTGTVADLRYYPGVRALETRIRLPDGWPGHRAGQFAFATADGAEGAHPYTIASAWNEADKGVTFIVKELGDHTRRLRELLRVGQDVTIEGPYGCFTFDDDRPHQIWVGGGIGITPFVARLQEIAADIGEGGIPAARTIHLFHSTREYDPQAIARLTGAAKAAGVTLHLLVDDRDGRLDGARIRDAVPDWRDASIWFCGPAAFGQALREDFAELGFPVRRHFHQELFAMR